MQPCCISSASLHFVKRDSELFLAQPGVQKAPQLFFNSFRFFLFPREYVPHDNLRNVVPFMTSYSRMATIHHSPQRECQKCVESCSMEHKKMLSTEQLHIWLDGVMYVDSAPVPQCTKCLVSNMNMGCVVDAD